MEENKKESEGNWLSKLKEGLNNPKAEIWKEKKKEKKDLWDPALEEDFLIEGQKVFNKIEITPEVKSILDEKRLENIKLKAEEEFKKRQKAEKAILEHEKKIKATQNKANAEKKKLDNKIKDFQNKLTSKGIRGFKHPKFDEKSGLVLTEVTRPYKVVFDNDGKLIIGADDIVFGDNGLFYSNDKILKSACLYHYDINESKLELLAKYESIKDLHKAIYKQDPQKKLGFYLFMDYNTQKEADEEIRVRKLTPAERLKEEKERKKMEADAKKAQMKLEKEKLQKAQSIELSTNEEFEKLFGK
jgi:hypothetical protein